MCVCVYILYTRVCFQLVELLFRRTCKSGYSSSKRTRFSSPPVLILIPHYYDRGSRFSLRKYSRGSRFRRHLQQRFQAFYRTAEVLDFEGKFTAEVPLGWSVHSK